jgi:hypothetical protein
VRGAVGCARVGGSEVLAGRPTVLGGRSTAGHRALDAVIGRVTVYSTPELPIGEITDSAKSEWHELRDVTLDLLVVLGHTLYPADCGSCRIEPGAPWCRCAGSCSAPASRRATPVGGSPGTHRNLRQVRVRSTGVIVRRTDRIAARRCEGPITSVSGCCPHPKRSDPRISLCRRQGARHCREMHRSNRRATNEPAETFAEDATRIVPAKRLIDLLSN